MTRLYTNSWHSLLLLVCGHKWIPTWLDLQQLIILASWWQQKYILADKFLCFKLTKCTGWKNVSYLHIQMLNSNINILLKLTDS